MRVSFKSLTAMSPQAATAVVVLGLGIMGWIDFVTGIEIRVLPLYYLPLSLAAWKLGSRGAIYTAIACALIWMASNYIAGMRYSSDAIWVVNLAMQGASFVVVGLLIARVRRSHREASELSRTDSLTGLMNARAFADEAGRVFAIGRRHHHQLTLAYIDLDNFKAVNDRFGHHRGDEALKTTADVLRRGLRAGDIVARLGGDEFVVLLPETGAAGATPLIERLRATLSDALKTDRYAITASIGAIAYATPPATIEQSLQTADSLMYAAKSGGKNAVRLELVA